MDAAIGDIEIVLGEEFPPNEDQAVEVGEKIYHVSDAIRETHTADLYRLIESIISVLDLSLSSTWRRFTTTTTSVDTS